MYYAPHLLYKKEAPKVTSDEFGRPIISNDVDKWTQVCRCRCDTSNMVEVKSDNGEFFKPDFHVVCEGVDKVKAGDIVRAVFNGVVKCEGMVKSVKETNYLSYTEIWI